MEAQITEGHQALENAIQALVATGITRATAILMLGDADRYQERASKNVVGDIRGMFKDAADEALPDATKEWFTARLQRVSDQVSELHGDGVLADYCTSVTVRVEATLDTATGEVDVDSGVSYSGAARQGQTEEQVTEQPVAEEA